MKELEEAALKHKIYNCNTPFVERAFIAGAQWQQSKQSAEVDRLRERLMQAFVQTLLMAGYTTDGINAKPKEQMEDAFQYWLDNPMPEYKYTEALKDKTE